MIVNRIIYRNQPKEAIFRSLVTDFFNNNPDCEVATISITKDKPKRSDAQNRLFHTWRDIIAEEMGESKKETKKQSIIRERPELADWWIEQEDSLKGIGTGSYFRKDTPSYQTMKTIALEQTNIFDNLYIDETIPCFCGD